MTQNIINRINKILETKVNNYELSDPLPDNRRHRVSFATHYGSLPQDMTIEMENGIPVNYRWENRCGAIGTKYLDQLQRNKQAIVETLTEINPDIEKSQWLTATKDIYIL